MPRDLLIAIAGLAWVAAAVLGVFWLRRMDRHRRLVGRLHAEAADEIIPTGDPMGAFNRWLYRAGYRSRHSQMLFLSSAAAAILCGALIVIVAYAVGFGAASRRFSSALPGAIGDLLYAVMLTSPWLAGITIAAIPWLIVRDARRKRIMEVERELPLVLELLATLTEAGLGLDMALDRILASQPPDHVLTREFRIWQRDLLAGRGRVESLRRLASRVDVLSLTTFVSALVQAEQVGSGVANVLRKQADDLRDRRRERAIAMATTLPVKLVFPLVFCFLPGLFVATLGPAFYNFVVFADSVIKNRGLR